MAQDAAGLGYRDPEWVAEQLGIDRNTVYKYLQDGTIPAVQLGRRWLIRVGTCWFARLHFNHLLPCILRCGSV